MNIEDPETPPDAMAQVTDAMCIQIADAMHLLEYAIESGFKTENGSVVSTVIVTTIKKTAALIGIDHTKRTESKSVPERASISGSSTLPISMWVDFELAYYDLAILMAPVTAQSLRNTDQSGLWLYPSTSSAYRFAGWLWITTMGFAGIVILGEWGLLRYGPGVEGIVDGPNTAMQIFSVITPYAFGGLGACVYLLRSAHQYIHERTFNLRRKPEYFNRILLGAIGGGAIILFISDGITTDGGFVKLSAAALGFLAGYSTDFLFSTIERVMAAILPKVGIETVRRVDPTPSRPAVAVPPGMTLKDLLDRYDAATGDDKVLYRALIDQFSRK